MSDRTHANSEEALDGSEGDVERDLVDGAHRSSEEALDDSSGTEGETLAGDAESGGP